MRVIPGLVGLMGLALCPAALIATTPPAAKPAQPAAEIAFPGGEIGIGFDDLAYSSKLNRLLVPAGRTGRLALVDPETGAVVSIAGFSTLKAFNGGHDDGVTSVAEGDGLLFATDRTSEQLSIVDPATRSIVGHAALSAGPDYVRWVEATHEIWVTEPDSERIEIFTLERSPTPHVRAVARISVPGGPESLLLDAKRGRAYTHADGGKTIALDFHTHAVVARWAHGCGGATGIALDMERGFLFVACEEGAITVIDVASGKNMGHAKVGAGIDIIAYSPTLGHVYVPSSETAKLAVLGVSSAGGLSVLGTFPGTRDSHCVAALGKVYYADPARGKLRILKDPFPASPH
jgi:hypothetical protein